MFSKCLDLFEVCFALRLVSVASKPVVFTKLLTSGILFSTAVNAELVAKPLILAILPSISVTLESKSVF